MHTEMCNMPTFTPTHRPVFMSKSTHAGNKERHTRKHTNHSHSVCCEEQRTAGPRLAALQRAISPLLDGVSSSSSLGFLDFFFFLSIPRSRSSISSCTCRALSVNTPKERKAWGAET